MIAQQRLIECNGKAVKCSPLAPRCYVLAWTARLASPDGSTYTGALNSQHQRHGHGSMHSTAGKLFQGGRWINDVLAVSRKALLFGNSRYDYPQNSLDCSINDAEDMQAVLQKLGFACTVLLDGSKRQMTVAIKRFLALRSNDLVFIYFSGHGAEAAGISYLLPRLRRRQRARRCSVARRSHERSAPQELQSRQHHRARLLPRE